jgi:hypothetical protein
MGGTVQLRMGASQWTDAMRSHMRIFDTIDYAEADQLMQCEESCGGALLWW